VKKSSLSVQVGLFTLTRAIINSAYRMVYPYLAVFARGLGVDVETFSLVLTGRSLMGLLSPLLAPLADRRGRKVSLLLGLGIYVLGAGAVALFPTLTTFIIALLLTTLGNFVFLPAMQAYLGDCVPYARRGRVMAITELSWSLAFIAGVPLLGWLLSGRGWPTPFALLAGLGALCLVLIVLFVPNGKPPLQHDANGDAIQAGGLKQVLAIPAALAALLVSFAITAANEVINLMFGVWLEDSFNLQLGALAASTAVLGLAELGGESLTVALVDRLGKRRAVTIGILANILASLCLWQFGGSQWGALISLFAFYLSFEFTMVSFLPLISAVAPNARATLMAANIMAFSLGRAAGALLGPQLYTLGFGANALAAVVINGLAVVSLRGVKEDE
jgi:DHA1 family inner membrane transport protein